MRLSLDPACAQARRLGKEHRRADSLLLQGLEQSRLAEILDEQRDAAFCAHLVACERCQRFVRTCGACGADLAQRTHKFTCAKNSDRWRGLLGSGEPPLAHLSPPAAASVPLKTAAAPRRASPPAAAAARAPVAAPTRAKAKAPAKPPPRPRPSAWDVLGVRPGAPRERIREAYHERALLYHPDRVGHMAPEFKRLAEERMREINAAYQALSRRG